MGTLRKDIKHALRLFRESKLFTATALAALTLGIGVNIAIFSVVNAVLPKPVPYPDPDTLVQLVNTNNGVAGGPASSPAKYMHWRSQSDVLEHVAAFRGIDLNLEQGDVPESIRAGQTSAVLRRASAAARHGPLVHGTGRPAEHRAYGGARLQLLGPAYGERPRGRRSVEARDVLVFVGVLLVLGATAFAAVSIAARHASRIDPLEALRYE